MCLGVFARVAVIPLVMVAQAFALLFKIANFLRVVWFDAIYAVLVAAFLPLMFGLF
jgi:hypothetical protein